MSSPGSIQIETRSPSAIERLGIACLEHERRIAELEGELAALRAASEKRDVAYSRLAADHADLVDAYARLERERDQLVKRFLGPKTEKARPDQQQLPFTGESQAENAPPTPATTETSNSGGTAGEKKPRRKGHGRKKLPAALERRQRVIEPEPHLLVCACGKHKIVIRSERSEQLERVPATLYVLETIRPIYACPDGCEAAVVCAAAPPARIDRGLGGQGLHAWLLTAKFGDHLPLNRISGILAREGVLVSTSTLGDWVKRDAFDLSPIYRAIRDDVLGSEIVRTDATSIRVIEKATQPDGAYNARIWAYLGCERGDVFFTFSRTQKNADPEGCHAVLANFEGTLQADASNGYDALFKSSRILECGCWAHCRRKLYEAKDGFPVALHGLELIGKLYKIEADAKLHGLDVEARRRLRHERSRPILDEFFAWVKRLAPAAVPKSLLATALGYALNQELALRRFLEDGRLEIDNNDTERALRHVVTGRKAWLFAGNDNGGRSNAVLSTLLYSCKELRIDPVLYLRDVLERLNSHPANRVHELTPRRWLAARRTATPDR